MKKEATFPQYRSPLTLLSKAGVTPTAKTLNKNDLLMARKVLLAEFELSKKTTIQWEGQELSKDAVLKMFDAFQSDNLIEYHNAIQADNALMLFLEKHKLDLDTPFLDNPIYETEGFKNFVGAYFGAAFTVNVRQLLNNPDFSAAQALFKLPQYWDGASERQNWQNIQGFLDKKLELLKKASKDLFSYGISIDGRGEKAFFHPDLISLLNFLPDSFEQYRTHYGLALLDVAISCFNKRKAETGLYIFERIKSLKGSFQLQMALDHVEGQLSAVDYGTRSGVSPGRAVWLVILLLISLVRILAAVSSCSRY